MPGRLLRHLLLVAALAWPAAAFSDGVVFSKLKVPGPVGDMGVTEDGRTLILSHTTTHRVTVWDVATAKQIKSVDCTSPGAILCRGGKVYIANRGKATLTVFSPAENWEPVDELESGVIGPVFLSAPGGKHFDGHIIVSCLERPDPNGDIRVVDVKKDENRRVYGERGLAVGAVDYDGQYLFFQLLSTWRFLGAYDYQKLINHEPQDARQTSRMGIPLLSQFRPGPFWLAGDRPYKGVPPDPLGPAYGVLAVADRTRDVFYALGPSSIRCIGLDERLSAGQSRPASYPDDFRRFHTKPATNFPDTAFMRTDFQHAAVTLGSELHLYLYDAATRSVFHARTAAFEIPRPGVAEATLKPGAKVKEGRFGPQDEIPKVTDRRFPRQIRVGQTITHALFGRAWEGTYQLKSRQKGVKISSTGVITWTPTKRDLGRQRLTFVAKVANQTVILQRETRVVAKLSPKPKPPAGPDLTSPLPPGMFRFVDKDYFAAYGLDGHSILLLADGRLHVLDPSGTSIRQTYDPPRRYTAIRERDGYYVALAKASVDLLDKTTLQVKKSIPLKYTKPHSLTLHPGRAVCYVAVSNPDKKRLLYASKPVVEVNETTGRVSVLPGVYGSFLAADPTGHYLFAAVKDTALRLDNADGPKAAHIVAPEYLIDVLLCYDIRDTVPRLLAYNPSAGVNCRNVVVSPDGRQVAYVGVGWSARFKYAVRTFGADNVAKDLVVYSGGASPGELSFHPMVDLVAIPNGDNVRIYARKSGVLLSGRISSDPAVKSILHLMFTPDGKHVLVAFKHPKYGPVVESLPLHLTPDEQAIVARGFHAPPPVAPIAAKPAVHPGAPLPLDQLEALRPARPANLTHEEIARRWFSAVVLIDHAEGSGSGFVVGSKGYILTCAHVLPKTGDAVVTYRLDDGESARFVRAKAAVLRADRYHDLALLQIKPEAPMNAVQLRTRGELKSGEEVTVIGNPGLGAVILRDTLTAGVVSYPRRVLDSLPYVQTSAAVNPGNSGGPMFDSHGQVIGVVVLKARIEAAAFAVPVETILDFLKADKNANK